ncbi:MAG: helix-turn-helix domain-containing protein, partial [Ruminiclostridium sp.]|nr:helix-turn-helix domain-containing protein [Ruminiclostridium sp.]
MEEKTIGAFLSALRKSKGLTQRELAEMLNVSDKAISR